MEHRRKNKTRNVPGSLASDTNNQTPNGGGANSEVDTDGDLFRACFAHAPIGFAVTDVEGRILEANSAFCAITGYTEAELRSMNFAQLEHPEDLARTTQELRALLAGDISDFVIEDRFIRKNGQTVCVQNSVSTIRDQSGRPAHLIRLTQDITERVQLFQANQAMNRVRAEESLRESEERYRDLVENSHELICTHDLNGRILSVNRAAVEILGYAEADLTQRMNIRDLLMPDVRYQFEEYMDRIVKAGATTGIILVQTASGDRRVLEYYNSLRTEGVDAPIVRGIARDITARRQTERALRESEERYRGLFENSKDIIYVHNMSGRYTSVNRAGETVSGYTREEIIGRPFWDFIAPEYVKSAREYLCKKLEEVGETSYEVELVTKDGQRIPVEVTSRIIYKEGLPIAVQGTARDIRERKQAQEALQTYSRRLMQAQETERQCIARELHDGIGQVLTAIRINLHTIQDMCQTNTCRPRVEESIAIIDEAIAQVRELSLNLRPALLDDLGLAAALRWYVHQFAQRTGLKTELISEIDSARLAWEVETACFRIAQEALTNVARHARATRAVVQLKRLPAGLRVTISDDGVGFDVKHVKRQVSALGLRGMTERACAAKGAVTIYSKRDVGTQVVALFRLDKE